MLEILLTDEFEKQYRKLPSLIKKKAVKQQVLFCTNPFYPSLNTEKLVPKNRNLWSFRVDKTYRIIFRFVENNKVLFLAIGTHDWIYKFVNYNF